MLETNWFRKTDTRSRLCRSARPKNGVVVPQPNSELPGGAHVTIVLQPADMPPELQEELEAWQRVGNEAWRMIDAPCTGKLVG